MDSGILCHSNTEAALLEVVDYICTNLDDHKKVVAVFIDLQKAFDTVNHEILLKHLCDLGFRSNELNLLKNYLTGRKQLVVNGSVRGDLLSVEYGVPQGSILGPLLYLLYINNMKEANISGKYVVYADDTVLLYSGNHDATLESEVNEDLARYLEWARSNELSLNTSKTHFMIFKQKNSILRTISLKIGDNNLSKVSCTKYLGLYIDENLNWKHHVNQITNKIIPLLF